MREPERPRIRVELPVSEETRERAEREAHRRVGWIMKEVRDCDEETDENGMCECARYIESELTRALIGDYGLREAVEAVAEENQRLRDRLASRG